MADENRQEHLVSLTACPPGLFQYGDCIGFKTEYGAMRGEDLGGGTIKWTVSNRPDAYVVASGEKFWGGQSSAEARDNLLVQPLSLSSLQSPPGVIDRLNEIAGAKTDPDRFSLPSSARDLIAQAAALFIAQQERIADLEQTESRWLLRFSLVREKSGVGHRPMLDEVADAIVERLAAKDREIAELRKLVHVPGVFRCARCDVRLVSTRLSAQDGRTAPDNSPQRCPNGCGPMWPVTERQAGDDLCDRLGKTEDAKRAGMEGLQSALEALQPFAAWIETFGGGWLATQPDDAPADALNLTLGDFRRAADARDRIKALIP